MKRLLVIFFWYLFGRLYGIYEDCLHKDDQDFCIWCGENLEECEYSNFLCKTLNSGTSFTGEYSGTWYHLEITCPKCFHLNPVEIDTTP